MKKILCFILSITLLMGIACLFSCAQKEEKIELNSENLRDYLQITFEVDDYEIEEDKHYIYGIPVYDYSGSYARVNLVINPKSSEFEFEDVSFTVKAEMTALNEFPWEFKDGNINEKVDGYNYNFKSINCTIPYDGKYSKEIQLVIGYNPDSVSLLDPSAPYISINSIEGVQGNVIKK